MESNNEGVGELTTVKSVSTGDFHTNDIHSFVPEKKHSRIDDPASKQDTNGCVHYKRRAKFVVSY